MASIRCAHCHNTHTSVPDVFACYLERQEEIAQANAEYAAEMGVERFYENQGFNEARNQEDHERRNGVVGFQEAWAQWNQEQGITDDGQDADDGCAAAERANEQAMAYGSAYSQMSSYQDYLEREREIYYNA